MNMIFEVQDLAVASPATVSRCGMVYMQAQLLGWRPILESWLSTLPEAVTEEHRKQIVALFEWLLPPALRIATRMIKNILPMQEINLAIGCMRLMETQMDEWRTNPKMVAEMNENMQTVWIQSLFLFSLVWSCGANTDVEGRKQFDSLLRRLLVNDTPADLKVFMKAPAVKVTQLFPEGKTVHEFTFDKSRNKWAPWMETVESKPIDPEAEYSTIVVPTLDTVRYTYLIDCLVQHNKYVLLVGPTGTGKTVYIKRHLQYGLPEKYNSMFFNFSAQTSANMTQDIIDGRLDKRKKGVFGPPPGKRMVIFVDDLNMPSVEVYGAQPPIELLRQWMDHSGWYDRKELTFRSLVDMQFVAAMGPPGGGRNSVTNRYLRHFNVLSVTQFDTATMSTIFVALVDWWMKNFQYDSNIQKLARPLVSATIELFDLSQKELLPTPTKSHYTFNLRDVSKVVQGIVRAGSTVEDQHMMLRLWCHESLRVFYDRLTDDEDRNTMTNWLVQLGETHFREKLPRMIGADSGEVEVVRDKMRYLMFADYMVPGQDPRLYAEVKDHSVMVSTCNEYLSDHNATSKKPMNLVLFLYALEHVNRICRIITSPGGNALLVGLGGSGRSSLTKLAAYIEEFEVFSIEISKTYGMNEWHEDIKKVLKLAGESNKKVVFLFADTQIKDETFVEDLSNLLNTYEVPNLLQNSDMVTVYENIGGRAKQAGMDGSKEQLYNFFLSEVRRNLHIVITLQPHRRRLPRAAEEVPFTGELYHDRLVHCLAGGRVA